VAQGEALAAEDAAFALRRFQNQIDSWQADRLTLSLLNRTVFTLTSGTSSVTIGPSGADITAQRPVWVSQVNYIIPGTSPAVETPMAPLNEDQYAGITIKGLSSSLPQQYFYQTNISSALGTFFFWPTVSQNVQIVIYAPNGVTVPVDLDTVVIGPPGYQEAFMYQLAIRLCNGYGKQVPPLLMDLAQKAWNTMTRPNIEPGLLGVDAAVVSPNSGGYNVLSDNSSGRY